jgi:purine-cytosine permease-like protein
MTFSFVAVGALVLLTLVCLVGASFYAKTNNIIFVVLLVAIVSCFASVFGQKPGVTVEAPCLVATPHTHTTHTHTHSTP